MRFRDLLACSIDSIFTKKWSNIVMIICMIITLDLVFSSAFMYNNTNFYKNRITKSIKSDFETTVNVTIESGSLMNEEYINNINIYIENLKEIKGVEYAGAYVTTMGFFSELMMNSEYKALNSECLDELTLLNYPQASMMLYTDYELFNIYDIDYDEVKYQTAKEDGYIPLVVGNAYEGMISEGDVFNYKEESYKVIKVIEESNQRWISQTLGIVLSSTNTINLDYYFIIPREYCTLPADYMHSIYFGVEKQASVTAVSGLVKAKAAELGIHASTKTVAESISEIEESEGKEAKYTTYMYLAMIGVCIVSASTVNIVSLLFRKREIGIFIANGVSIREVFGMTFLENVIKVFVTCATVFINALIKYKEYLETPTSEILTNSLGIIWVLGAVILIISSIVPIGYIASKQPREFLEECL